MDSDLFQYLVSALDQNKGVHLNIVWGTMAFQVAAIGWFISSETARTIVSRSHFIRRAGIALIGLVAVLHYIMIFETYSNSIRIEEAIKSTPYFSSQIEGETLTYLVYSVTLRGAIARSMFTFLFFTFLIFIVHWCKNISDRSARGP